MRVGLFHAHLHDVPGGQRGGDVAQEHLAVDFGRVGLAAASGADIAVLKFRGPYTWNSGDRNS